MKISPAMTLSHGEQTFGDFNPQMHMGGPVIADMAHEAFNLFARAAEQAVYDASGYPIEGAESEVSPETALDTQAAALDITDVRHSPGRLRRLVALGAVTLVTVTAAQIKDTEEVAAWGNPINISSCLPAVEGHERWRESCADDKAYLNTRPDILDYYRSVRNACLAEPRPAFICSSRAASHAEQAFGNPEEPEEAPPTTSAPRPTRAQQRAAAQASTAAPAIAVETPLPSDCAVPGVTGGGSVGFFANFINEFRNQILKKRAC